jgi:predicted TIM-barrel fold metal-dependent hydrolase
MAVIDSDAHVVESERTWDFMAPSDQKYRPVLVNDPTNPRVQYWMVEGKLRGLARQVLTAQQLAETSERFGRNIATAQEAREMENVEVRLRHMDELGVDMQVLHNTVFIREVAATPESDVAISKGWNRWLADIWKQGKGRLRWSCVLPLTVMDEALKEMRFARENGAVAVCMRAIENDKLLHNPYFYPIYEEASRLNMAIAVHIGNANTQYCDLVSQYNEGGSAFWMFRLTTVGGFHALMQSGMMANFPKLRMGFIECSAGWLPYVLSDLRRRMRARGRPLSDNPLRDNRLYVTCQTDDDVPYLVKHVGEDNLLIGTDYGHNDQSSEIEALRILREEGGLDQRVVNKILDDNPRALYGLSLDDVPRADRPQADAVASPAD